MSTEETTPYGVAFWVSVGGALVAFAIGISTMVDRGTMTVFRVGGYVLATDLAHDLLLLPVVAAFALALRRLPGIARPPVGAALGWTLVVGIVSVPLVGGFGRARNNPSILPLDYSTAVPTALATGWLLCAAWLVVRVVRADR